MLYCGPFCILFGFSNSNPIQICLGLNLFEPQGFKPKLFIQTGQTNHLFGPNFFLSFHFLSRPSHPFSPPFPSRANPHTAKPAHFWPKPFPPLFHRPTDPTPPSSSLSHTQRQPTVALSPPSSTPSACGLPSLASHRSTQVTSPP